jgi:arsenate reductase
MKEVLFICEGNVGRSQMAEAFYNDIKEGNTAISAGIVDVAEKYGGHPAQEIIDVMSEKGIDVSRQQIKQLTQDMLFEAAMIIVLCDKEMCPDFLVSSELNILYYKTEDPYQASIDTTRHIRDQIEMLVTELIES